MAIPDPFLKELRIKYYISRPRACKVLYKVPRRNDFIDSMSSKHHKNSEVLWCLDDLPRPPHKWCSAEVLHIYDGMELEPAQTCNSKQYQQKHLAKRVVLYLPEETWHEQVDEVEFLEGHELRCSASRLEKHKEERVLDINGRLNPTIKWRFRESNSQIGECDSDWTDDLMINNNQLRSRALIRANSKTRNAGLMDIEVKSLRDRHMSLNVELEKVKRELVWITHQLKSFQTLANQQGICASAMFLFPRLRHKIALRMHASLKQYSAIMEKRKDTESDWTSKRNIIEGIYRDTLKVRVECTLHQFESISHHVKVSSPPGSASFFPYYT